MQDSKKTYNFSSAEAGEVSFVSNTLVNPTHIISEAEYDNAEAAFAEFEQLGATNRRCLRCGSSFVFEDFGSAYRIKCETGDFEITAHGI